MFKSYRSKILALCLTVSIAMAQVSPARADINLPAEINQQFTPLQIDAGGLSILKITIFNPNTLPLTDVGFTDDLLFEQPGLYVASTTLVSNSCGGSVAFTNANTFITLSGGAVAAQVTTPGQCSIEIEVSSTAAGNLINTIKTNALSAKVNGGLQITNTSPASATITVIAVDAPSMSKTFAPNTIYVGQTSQLTITINNNDADTNLTNVSFTDTLPLGVILATPVSPVVTGCGGYSMTANATENTITFSGGTITPSINCVIKVNVAGASGIYTNTIPAGPNGSGSLHTQQGVTNTTAVTADLNIQ